MRTHRPWLYGAIGVVVLLMLLVPYTLLSEVNAWYGSFLFWTVGALIALVAAFVSRAGKAASMSDYFLGGRRMGGLVSAMSYSATTYSA
ncbi:hypothetical protein [Nesterenkonia populi]|uniref:hypothetical protein n=1 Tax=Nesterenkonia populi TaxID=1591087 RepID=UPI0011BEE4A9|nr:hypothetical protein [Nesterenkonia populi]